jgi:hypothetical protein
VKVVAIVDITTEGGIEGLRIKEITLIMMIRKSISVFWRRSKTESWWTTLNYLDENFCES